MPKPLIKHLRSWALFGHKWMGIIAAIPILILCATGLLLAFEKDLQEFEEREAFTIAMPEDAASERLSLSEIIDAIEPNLSGEQVHLYYPPRGPDRAVKIRTNKRTYLFVNPYTGEVTKTTKTPYPFMRGVRVMHTSFFLGDFGTWVAIIAAFAFLLLSLTGAFLFFKRRGGIFRKSKMRFNKGTQVRNLDLHSVVGFYAAGLLGLIALSGALLGIGRPWQQFIRDVSQADWQERPKVTDFEEGAKMLPADTLLDRIEAVAPEGLVIRMAIFPTRTTDPFRIRYSYPWADLPASWGYAHPGTGEILAFNHFPDYDAGQFIYVVNRALHSGDMFNDAMRWIWIILMLITVMLIITAYFLWRPRRRKKLDPS
ncbi:MAG: PepSY-associated TM helix domain-containing protein [Verrucomicrobiota bacterium]